MKQNGDEFKPGPQQHVCKPRDCAIPAANIKAHIRKEGKERPFASGSTLVKEALQQHLPSDAPASSLPAMPSLVRTTNILRQARRPAHPTSLNFKWVSEALPEDFVQEDIKVGQFRHVIMFTQLLLTLLTQAKSWYVDATFKAVQNPFKQLWSIHAFVKQKECTKQIPLVFVLMSQRSKEDYVQVLKSLQNRLPTTISLHTVIMDFEAAVWRAFPIVFPGIKIHGCAFHWSQAVWKRIQEAGLAPTYRQKRNTSKFLKQLMCMPFLPAEQIPTTFQQFRDLVTPAHPEPIHKLLDYFEDTWINGHIWKPENWSVFGMSVRTNNDCEGWHLHLNRLCEKVGNGRTNMYELIEVLHREALQASTQCQLVTEEKLQRYQRATFKTYQQEIFHIWDEYREKKVSPQQLLQNISLLYMHAPSTDEEPPENI